MKREMGDAEWTVTYETIAYRESMDSRVWWIDNGGNGVHQLWINQVSLFY